MFVRRKTERVAGSGTLVRSAEARGRVRVRSWPAGGGTAVVLAATGAMLLSLSFASGSMALTLDWSTIDGGGATQTTGGIYRLSGTIGQPDAGEAAGGAFTLRGGFWRGGAAASGVPEPGTDGGLVPGVLRMSAGIPNPFVAQTQVRLELPELCATRVEVFDLLGRRIRLVYDGELPAGRHQLAWDGRDASGHRAPSGLYLLRLAAADQSITRRVVMLGR